MSTRSFIAMFDEDTTKYTAIYCHHDGYPEGVGLTLRDHYTTTEKISELMKLGDISSLDDTVGATEVSSYRVWGENNVDADTFGSLMEMLNEYRNRWCEFGYVWEDGRWNCHDLHTAQIDLYELVNRDRLVNPHDNNTLRITDYETISDHKGQRVV